MEEEVTPQEMEILKEALSSQGYGTPQPEEKYNVHAFLHRVSVSPDTTKTGFLTEEEIGSTPYSLRAYKQLSLESGELANDEIWEGYFLKLGEILTATSLSKEAKLISLAVLQRRELADVTKPRKENKGWFKKKEDNPQGEPQ